MVQNAHSCPKKELKHFATPYMESPPLAVFQNKYKKEHRLCYTAGLSAKQIKTAHHHQYLWYKLQIQKPNARCQIDQRLRSRDIFVQFVAG